MKTIKISSAQLRTLFDDGIVIVGRYIITLYLGDTLLNNSQMM